MSDVVWQALIAGAVAIYMEWSRRQTATKVEQEATKTARKVDAVALKAAVAVRETAKRADEVKQTLLQTTVARVAQVEEVKHDLSDARDTVKHELSAAAAVVDSKLESLAKVADATHVLVNSRMGIQLELNAVMARRLAVLTRDPEDVRAADLAEDLYRDHQAKQAVVDSKDEYPTRH